MLEQQRTKKIWGLSPNVFFLGIVSLLTDISSEMIFTLVPLFLANVLGMGTTVIGLVGGLSESTDALFKILSGWLSDRAGRRKPLAVLGYSLSTLAKPCMYIAASWGAVTAIRFTDRVGKGFRGSPRDALIADSVSVEERGRSFGIHRAMDTTGAALGLTVAAVITYLVQGSSLELSLNTYRWLVVVGTIPAVLGVLVLLAFVRERRNQEKSPDGSQNHRASIGGLTSGFSTRFKLFLLVIGLFTLGNSTDFFVILRAQDLGAPVLNVILMLIVFNATYAASALPAGLLSDKMGRRGVIAIGWLVYALVYLGFAVASQMWQIWLLFACYGIYYGMVEGVARAFVADLVPPEKRGTAYGLYHGIVGIVLLPASIIGGWLWQTISPSATFYFGAGFAFLAVAGILVLIRE